MKVLLDHNIPHQLRHQFPEDHSVYTAHYLGWSDFDDDALLTTAVDHGFEVFVTLDSSIPDQRHVSAYGIGIVVLAIHPATPSRLSSGMKHIEEVLTQAAKTQRTVVIGGHQ